MWKIIKKTTKDISGAKDTDYQREQTVKFDRNGVHQNKGLLYERNVAFIQ